MKAAEQVLQEATLLTTGTRLNKDGAEYKIMIKAMNEYADARSLAFYEFTRKKFSFKCSKKEAEENFLFFDRVNDGKGTASPEKMLNEFKNLL